ncbi:MAG: hypothetical protein K8S15_11520 [Candidatus Aegiribacteria sp.]|nr:hypothetical protein [Candidatus Aegiribacteria sp.]
MFFLLISLTLTSPDVTINIPDSVQVGAVFTFDITIRGENIRSVNCTPVFSNGLQYMGSSSMNSFSTVTTSSGTSISSEIRLSMSFTATASGTHTIGPLMLTSSGRELLEIPIRTVSANGVNMTLPDASIDRPPVANRTDEIAWMEIEIDTTGRIYPGKAFNIDYYICKTRRNAEIVDLYLEPSDYAASSLVENIDELQWVRCKNGVYRTWLATLEVTPAFACTLSLPILKGRIGIAGGMLRPSMEHLISTEGARIPVFPFPEINRPDNFFGITDGISFRLDRVTRGYSAAGERCLQLSVSGPGYSQLKESPELTVHGPAELLAGSCFPLTDDTNAWYILIEPSDSGTVIVGPDSIAWFDTSLEEYRQAIVPSCTLSVFPPVSMPVEIPILNDNSGGSSLIWILTVSVLLTAIILFTLRYRNRIVGSVPGISEAKDIEELLTSIGYELSLVLTGSRSYMGTHELDEALDERTIDVIMARRLLRHWKDLELTLTGRAVSTEQLKKLKEKSIELVRELEAELDDDNSESSGAC